MSPARAGSCPPHVSPSPLHPWRRGRGRLLGGGVSTGTGGCPLPGSSCLGQRLYAPRPLLSPLQALGTLRTVGSWLPAGHSRPTPGMAWSSQVGAGESPGRAQLPSHLEWQDHPGCLLGCVCPTRSLLVTNVHFCEQDGLRKSLPIHAQTAGLEQQGSEGAGPSPVGLSLIQLGMGVPEVPGSPRCHSLCLCL